jgi:nucleoside 2-deoxyribosyltransferase
MTIHDLRLMGLAYLATPYSLYQAGIDKAFEDACAVNARLAERGVTAFSPIAHSHPIAMHGRLNPKDGMFWIKHDELFIERCDLLIVAQLDGWEVSEGVTFEIDAFKCAGKPIYYLNPKTLEVRIG